MPCRAAHRPPAHHHRKQEARLDGRRQDRARAKELLEDVAPRETGRDKMVGRQRLGGLAAWGWELLGTGGIDACCGALGAQERGAGPGWAAQPGAASGLDGSPVQGLEATRPRDATPPRMRR